MSREPTYETALFPVMFKHSKRRVTENV
jgi:hypothetical protein